MIDDDAEHGWTLAGLRRVIFATLDERDRRYQQRFDAQEEAIKKTSENRANSTSMWALVISVGSLLASIGLVFFHR